MGGTVIPEDGLVLPAIASDSPEANSSSLSQILQLRLENGMLVDMMKAARQPSRHPQLSCGRTIKLHYGTTTRTLLSTPTKNPSYLYSLPASDAAKPSFEGQLSHELDLPKVDELSVEPDEAIAKLTSRLASAKEARQNQQIKFVPNSANLPPTKAHRASLLKQRENNRSQNRTQLSEADSPAMAPAKPPVYTSRSQQEERIDSALRKHKAIRQAAVHVLAHRQMSTKRTAEVIRCLQREVEDVMAKIATPSKSDSRKWQLKDAAYKELDPWTFAYEKDEERAIAIDNAITAFDRLRLSGNSREFQRLLPVHDRDKGKSLSRLGHLNKGPIRPPATGTPKIQVQQPDGASKRGDLDGAQDSQDESKGDLIARARKPNSAGKTRKSEDVKAAKPVPSKSAKTATVVQNAKSAPKKSVISKKVNGATLSAEYVGDSDDEDEPDDVLPSNAAGTMHQSANKDNHKLALNAEGKTSKPILSSKSTALVNGGSSAKGVTKPRPKPKPKQDDQKSLKETATKPRMASDQDEGPPSRKDGSSTDSTKRKAPGPGAADSRAVKRPRNGSSPHKPSPLGSSPPTNASDTGERELSSSASSTPLIQIKKQSPVSLKSHGQAQTSVERHVNKKFNGEPEGHGSHGLANVQLNGNHDIVNRMTPPSSDSYSSTPLNARTLVMEKMRVFKEVSYPEYARLYKELSDANDPPYEKVETLHLKHKLIAEQKETIIQAFKDLDG